MQDILQQFPEPQFAMAYGSAVFKQAGYSSKEQPMLDLIFAVDDPLAWHNENLRRNPQHYTLWAPLIGGSGMCAIQSRAAQIYYNAHWPSLKYGIISTQCLIDDLRHWNTLYVAGRMHKPIMCLKQNQAVADAAKVNLQSAFCAALLTLPARFTDLELFTSIAGLSYAGDVRFRIGFENPNKVRNLVQPHVSTFRELYRPYFSQFLPACPPSISSPTPLSHIFPWSCEIAMHVQTQPTTDTLNLEQDMSPSSRAKLFASLPKNMQASIRSHGPTAGLSDVDLLSALDSTNRTKAAVLHGVSSVVGPTSFWQSLKGNLTSRPSTNVKYMWQKFQKSMRK